MLPSRHFLAQRDAGPPMLTNRYFVAVGVPFILLLLGATSRKLVHARPWKREDCYL